jgi:hypothetical protein
MLPSAPFEKKKLPKVVLEHFPRPILTRKRRWPEVCYGTHWPEMRWNSGYWNVALETRRSVRKWVNMCWWASGKMFILGALPVVCSPHNLADSPCWPKIREAACLSDLNCKLTTQSFRPSKLDITHTHARTHARARARTHTHTHTHTSGIIHFDLGFQVLRAESLSPIPHCGHLSF